MRTRGRGILNRYSIEKRSFYETKIKTCYILYVFMLDRCLCAICNDATQAFARNQLILESDVDSFQNLSQKGGQIKGHLSGEMTSSQKEQLASRLFHVWGGVLKDTRQTSDYYVAYGYTSGIAFCKKINGQKINLNLAITYDEISDETTVYLGVPLLNTDF